MTSLNLPRTHSAIRSALGLLAALSFGHVAAGQYSTLTGQVSASGTGTFTQSHTNEQFPTLNGADTHDSMGNKSLASGTIATPAGEMRLSSHACSGGGPGFGGYATGQAQGQVILDYLIKSSTLPNGTPVSVNVRWAITASAMAVMSPSIASINAGAIAGASGGISITINGNSVLNLSGEYRRTHSTGGGGITNENFGTLHVQEDHGDHILNVLVGQVVRISFTGTAASASGAAQNEQTDGDVQMALVWGVASLNPDATAVWYDNQSEPAPPPGIATVAHAHQIQPPRDPYLMPCFEIPTQPVPTITCAAGSPQFSVFPLGTGPFTYQWHLQNSAESSTTLGSEPTALPCGGSAYATNPGGSTTNIHISPCPGVSTYYVTCIITNPCGAIASETVALDLCMADINCTGTVDIDDLVGVIVTWGQSGQPGSIAADITRNGAVDIDDLVAVITSWGRCL